jgi:hypothetical protein
MSEKPKCYKLIKEYPGSPTLGTIATYRKDFKDYIFNDNNCHQPLPVNRIITYPEFWEEVIKKDYEILSLINDANVVIGPEGIFNPEYYTNSGLWKIHSVKRLSDGEVFTVGDKCEGGIIKGFKQVNNNCPLSAVYDKDWFSHDYVTTLKKPKTPLFTTEDGVEVFEGDRCWYVNFLLILCGGNPIGMVGTKHNKFKWFSTKEAAEKYIEENKPKYSEKDMLDFADKYKNKIIFQHYQIEKFLNDWKLKRNK